MQVKITKRVSAPPTVADAVKLIDRDPCMNYAVHFGPRDLQRVEQYQQLQSYLMVLETSIGKHVPLEKLQEDLAAATFAADLKIEDYYSSLVDDDIRLKNLMLRDLEKFRNDKIWLEGRVAGYRSIEDIEKEIALKKKELFSLGLIKIKRFSSKYV